MIGLRGILLSVVGHVAIAGWLMSTATSAPSPAEDMSAANAVRVTVTLAREEAPVAPEDAPPPATEQQVETPPAEQVPDVVASLPKVVPPVTEPEHLPTEPVAEISPPEPEITQPTPTLESAPVTKVEPTPEPKPEKATSIDPSLIRKVEPPKPVEIVEKIKPKQVQKKIEPPARKIAGDGKGFSKPKPASAGSSGGKQQASGGAAQNRTYAALVLAKLRNARQEPRDGATGRVTLSFTISASGSLVSANASGGGSLKSAALGMVHSAAPFPPMLEGMNRPHMSFTVPVQFN
jgi:protein TonB